MSNTKVTAETDRGEKPNAAASGAKKIKKKIKSNPAKVENEDAEGAETKKKKKKGGRKRLIMNVSQTKYYVVRYVAKNIYKMKLTNNDDEDWDIRW